MAGTDRRRRAAGRQAAGAPVIVLVEPQLGENIGTAARAMWNCGLEELRLVRPRDRWPNTNATQASSGAEHVVEGARLFETAAEAVADLTHVFAASARRRDMIQRVMTPRAAAAELHRLAAAGGRAGVLFGPERAGLDNDDMALADAVIEAPLNPAHRSLNLAQAVLLVAYEWFVAADGAADGAGEGAAPAAYVNEAASRPATKAELQGLFEQLERELDACGFLRVEAKRPTMVRNIRNIFQRAGLMEQEVRTLRGIITGLVKGKRREG